MSVNKVAKLERVTVDQLKEMFPNKKKTITPEAVDMINASFDEPEFMHQSMLDMANMYKDVLVGIRGSISEYFAAIKFCSYLSTPDATVRDSYIKTFKHRDFVQKRMNEKPKTMKYMELANAAARYRKSKLVVELLTMTQIPLDMMFTGERYKAVALLADRMIHSKYDRDKISAAKELLIATKGAENINLRVSSATEESSAVKQLTEQLATLAGNAITQMQAGTATLKDVGSLTPNVVADAEFEEVVRDGKK